MILRADLLIRRGFGCFIRLQPLGDHWLCSPDLHAAALIRPRDGRPRLTGASVPTQGQGPQQMEHIWGMHQPHQRTAFDQTGALLGDHRWGLAPARGGHAAHACDVSDESERDGDSDVKRAGGES